MRRRLFAPSMIIAMIALVVALGGVGFTATRLPKGSVGSAQLRSKAVTAAKIAPGAVTGAAVKDLSLAGGDIDLARLGKVPSASTADRATSAASATAADRATVAHQVDGQHVEPVRAEIALGSSAKVIGADGGLEIAAACSVGGELSLVARSTTPRALVRATVISAFVLPPTVSVVEDADLNPGEDLALFNDHGRGTAQVAYLGSDGRVATALIGFGELTGLQVCTVAGTVVGT